MKIKLFDVADVIRSKNSGPYELTFDIIFKEVDLYQKVWESGVISKELFASLYHISVDQVISIVNLAAAKAIKITIVRPIASGALGETDVYGAQQHAPLMELVLEI